MRSNVHRLAGARALRLTAIAVLFAAPLRVGEAGVAFQDGATPAAAPKGWSPTAALVGGAADLDRSGDTTAAEWLRFASGFRVGAGGRLDRIDVQARLLAPLLDADRDGAISRAELEAVRARWDTSGDGIVDAGEFRAGSRAISGDSGFIEELVLRLADGTTSSGTVQRDGVLGADEWSAFLASQPQDAAGKLLPIAPYVWVTDAAKLTDSDRNAFSPDVFLLTLASDLDVDKSGVISGSDLDALFAALDTDGDRALSAAELAEPPEAPADPAGGSGARQRFERAGPDRVSLPCLMPFQRNLEDALHLVELTGKPLLVCVNMDGENASESFAWYRYRDPQFAALARGFVCVIASPDRRTPLDHDDRGRRLPDQRFGRVLNQEHIDIEPALFERYFQGTRAAPRHVGVAPDGTILFDVFLVQDLSIVDRALAEHGVRADERSRAPEDMSLDELLASPDALHRAYLEKWFCDVDAGRRIELLDRALAIDRRTQHPELVRLGLFDSDAAVRGAALRVVAARPGALGPALVLRAARLAGSTGEAGKALVEGLRRWALAEPEPTRRALAARHLNVFLGLCERSTLVDVERWRVALALEPAASDPFGTADDFDAAIAALEAAHELEQARPGDAEVIALHAAACLRCGRAALAAGQNPLFHFQDALAAARRAGEPGLPWLAWSAWLVSDFAVAEQAATAALPALASRAGTVVAHEVLRIFATLRTRTLYAAMTAGEDFAPAQVADLVAAHRVLVSHPSASVDDRLAEVRFLAAIEAWRELSNALESAVREYRDSSELHDAYRASLLRDSGAAGLRDAYRKLAGEFEDEALVAWYRGLAELFAAEHALRTRDPATAALAYDECVAVFDDATRRQPWYEASAQHYATLARAGRARLLAEDGRLADAVAALEDAFARNADALDAFDGLGRSPRAGATELLERLRRGGESELVARVEDLLD